MAKAYTKSVNLKNVYKEAKMKQIYFLIIFTFFITCYICFSGVKINGVGTLYSTIQEAVDAAQDLDVLHVAGGIYNETVTVSSTNRITIRGGYDATCTTYLAGDITAIIANGAAAVIAQHAYVVLDGLKLTGGGNGIHAIDNSTVICLTCKIFGNNAGLGGGIYAKASEVSLDHSQVFNNTATDKGGGARILDKSVLTIYDMYCDIMSNSAPVGGGVALNDSTLIVKDGGCIHGNQATESGGGIYMQNNSTSIVRSLHSNIGLGDSPNTAPFGGGIYSKDSTVIISNSASVFYNVADNNGGGVYLTNSLMILDDATVGSYSPDWRNEAYNGGGIYLLASRLLVYNNGQIRNCEAVYGAGIYATNSMANFISGAVLGDDDTNIANYASIRAGGLYALNSDITLDDTTVVGNNAGSYGGAFWVSVSSMNINNSFIERNTSGKDGGAFSASNGGQLILDSTQVISNYAGEDGGAFECYGLSNFIVRNESKINYNSAGEKGGAAYLSENNLCDFNNCEINNNSAGTDGGAVYVFKGLMACTDCSMFFNNADKNGGAFNIFSFGSLKLEAENKSAFLGNNGASNGGAIYLDKYNAAVDIIASSSSVFNVMNNEAVVNGGGIFVNTNCTINIAGNVYFVNNTSEYGGGLYAIGGSDCIISSTNNFQPWLMKNSAAMDGGAIYAADSQTKVKLHSVNIGNINSGNISGNEFGNESGNGGGGGIALFDDAELTAINTKFTDNKCAHFGGAIYSFNSKITIDSDFSSPVEGILPPSLFVGNIATSHVIAAFGVGGAIFADGVGCIDISHAAFVSNISYSGGAVALYEVPECNMINTLITRNHAEGEGGAIYNLLSTNKLFNCTIAHNSPDGIISVVEGDLIILLNSIVWGHTNFQVSTGENVNYCDIQNGYSGVSNINSLPVFAGVLNMDYQLLSASPCIDIGFNSPSITNDCIGNIRPYDGGWDIGCYEFIPEGSGVLFFGIFILFFRKIKSKL